MSDSRRLLTPEEISRITAKEHTKDVRTGKSESWITPAFALKLLACMDTGSNQVILGGREFRVNHVNDDKIWVYAAEGKVPCGWYTRNQLKSRSHSL